jgi:serine/threonine-protein kinase/endoribonuclease IRE1
VLGHPYFWTPNRRLEFLQDLSDRLEIESREIAGSSKLLSNLERYSIKVIGPDWTRKMSRHVVDELVRFRTYNYALIQDLLRAMRNKKHHYHDLPVAAKKELGTSSAEFLGYFVDKFPNLFIHVYTFVATNFKEDDAVLGVYFKHDIDI